MAVLAVRIEPVLGAVFPANRDFYRELLHDFGLPRLICVAEVALIQQLAQKFPRGMNRDFFRLNREAFLAEQGNREFDQGFRGKSRLAERRPGL